MRTKRTVFRRTSVPATERYNLRGNSLVGVDGEWSCQGPAQCPPAADGSARSSPAGLLPEPAPRSPLPPSPIPRSRPAPRTRPTSSPGPRPSRTASRRSPGRSWPRPVREEALRRRAGGHRRHDGPPSSGRGHRADRARGSAAPFESATVVGTGRPERRMTYSSSSEDLWWRTNPKCRGVSAPSRATQCPISPFWSMRVHCPDLGALVTRASRWAGPTPDDPGATCTDACGAPSCKIRGFAILQVTPEYSHEGARTGRAGVFGRNFLATNCLFRRSNCPLLFIS